jgi:uncharacterized protein (TIGR03083 family)
VNAELIVTDVSSIRPFEYDEVMALAAEETRQVLNLVDSLSASDWQQPTDCAGWTVRDVLGHLLGMWQLQSDPEERARQLTAASAAARESGRIRLDELTALQVANNAHLSSDELRQAMHDIAPRALAARAAMPEEVRAMAYDPEIPGVTPWTFGYLFGVIHTRDPWMHRVDICRAIGGEMHLTTEHDRRLVADVVAEWARRHNHPFRLNLTGPAGGHFVAGQNSADEITLDAVEFCRILSGRAEGSGLLSTSVAF